MNTVSSTENCLPFGDREPRVAGTAWIAPLSVLIGDVTVGADASIFFGAVVRADLASITIGDRSNVQDNATLHADPGHALALGRGVSVGHNAVLHGCVIEDNCLIGMGATVMNGVRVGEGSLVAAGAVILEGTQIPAGSLVAGVPARVRRALTPAEIDTISTNARTYCDLAQQYAGR